MTTQKLLIRDETKDDAAVITEVTVAAFASMEISNHTEQFIIKALRSARALTLSLVADSGASRFPAAFPMTTAPCCSV